MAGVGSSRRLAVLVLPFLVLFIGSSAEEEKSVLRVPDTTYELLIAEVGLDNPIIQFAPSSLVESSCERIHVTSLSRLNLGSYASSLHVSLMVSEAIPERLHGKIEVCFHRNASIGLCDCKKDEWQILKKGKWSAVMSPYETRFIDVEFKDKIYGTLTVSVEEEFQHWRLICLGFGFFLLIIAPMVSHWVPFYYSTSMALGVLLVVLIILFQGMKLLPMGRKNVFYLTIYGSVLGVGSIIAHYFSTIVNSILVSFGLNEEMHNPVSVFLLLGIFLAGASLGYWIVRKFILSDDGNVDAGIAQFVRWAMRVVAVVSIFQSTLDPLLALAASALCIGSCFAISSIKWRPLLARKKLTHQKDKNLWQQRARHASAGFRQAQFFSRSAERGTEKLGWRNLSTSGTEITGLRNLTSPYLKSNSPTQGQMYSSPAKTSQHQDYYSTFHKMPRRRFSKREWEDFTSESTKEALSEWAASPEVSKWIADNAHRMRLDPDNSDESMASSSGSSEETAVEDGTGYNIWKWY